MPPSLRFRPYLPEDHELLNRLGHQVYKPLLEIDRPPESEVSQTLWAELCEEEELLAQASFYMVLDVVVIQYIWVKQELQGKGFGKRLVLAIEKLAHSKACHRILSSSFRGQGSDGFWRACQFEVIGEMSGSEDSLHLTYFGKQLQQN